MFSGKKRAFLLYHRRAGKDIACWNFLIHQAIHDKVGIYYYVLPTYTQGKKVIWDGINENGERLLEYIPKVLLQSLNTTEMKIRLINGSLIQVIGAENYDSIRGTNPYGVVFSEFAMQEPRIWTEIVSPILLKNGGWAVFNTTPMGKNHAHELWSMAIQNPSWYTQKLTIEDTHLIAPEMLDKEREEGKPEEIIQQEYYCSFTRGVDGSYYGKLMQKVREEERIMDLPLIPDLPCHTSWDIGVGDSTSIWIFQELRNGKYNFINYYENHGEGLEHYVNYLNEWKTKNKALWGKHFVPHDMQNREFTSGVDRMAVAKDFGYVMTIIPRKPVAEGIQAARSIIPLSNFSMHNCKRGIDCLDNYHKKYNDILKYYYDEPLHDQWSHGADAFRMAAIGIKMFNKGGSVDGDYKALRKYWGE